MGSGKYGCCGKVRKDKRVQKMLEVSSFTTVNSIFPGVDMGSDMLTAINLIKRGHPKWGMTTLSLMFIPFLAKTILAAQGYCLEENTPLRSKE